MEGIQVLHEQEDNFEFSQDILLNYREIAKQGEITIKQGHDIQMPSKLPETIKKFLGRKNILYLGKFQKEYPIQIKEANNNYVLPLVTTNEIENRLKGVKSEDKKKISYIHFGRIQIILKSTYFQGIDSPIEITIVDNRILPVKERIIGKITGNLKITVIKFDISLHYGIPITSNYLKNSIGLIFNFERKNLMNQDDYPFTITYAVGYALSNSHHSIQLRESEKITIDEIFERNGIHFIPTALIEQTNPRPLLKDTTYQEEAKTSKIKIEGIDKPVNILPTENTRLSKQIAELTKISQEIRDQL